MAKTISMDTQQNISNTSDQTGQNVQNDHAEDGPRIADLEKHVRDMTQDM